MIVRRCFVAISLFVIGSMNVVSSGWAISDDPFESDEVLSLLPQSSGQANTPAAWAKATERKTPPRRITRRDNTDASRYPSLQSCTYRGGPKTGTWACR
jgi:hypothetical protein